MRRMLALALVLAGCGRAADRPDAGTAGAALERAAVARGVVADPARIDPVGLYASASDRLCVVPRGDGYRVGASVDFGEGQGCFATGTATGRSTLDIRFDAACRLTAAIEGDRVTFPATLPAGCDRFCTGRASLAALAADRISASAVEAASAATGDGKAMCP